MIRRRAVTARNNFDTLKFAAVKLLVCYQGNVIDDPARHENSRIRVHDKHTQAERLGLHIDVRCHRLRTETTGSGAEVGHQAGRRTIARTSAAADDTRHALEAHAECGHTRLTNLA